MMRPVKELLSSTVELYRAHLWLFIGYAAWMLVPTAAFIIVHMTIGADNPWYLLMLPIGLAGIFLYFWVVSTLTKTAHQLNQGKLIDSKKLSTSAMRTIAPLLATTFLVGLITMGGLLLLIIPGIIFSIWYSQAVLATIIEEKRPVASLARSKQLVAGRFWDVLLYIFAGSIILSIPYLIALGIPTSIGALITGMHPLELLETSEVLIWPEVIQSIVDMFFVPLFLIYQVVLYQELVQNPLEPEAKVA
ncbi:MAG: hypothetical protein P8J32_02600 [bacterium]|jgi:hypothetical protein|nr:hypothetical protein [bacterium]